MITKRQLIDFFGSEVAVAETLGIGRAAVNLWPLDKTIPKYRELQLRVLYPNRFGKPKDMVLKNVTPRQAERA